MHVGGVGKRKVIWCRRKRFLRGIAHGLKKCTVNACKTKVESLYGIHDVKYKHIIHYKKNKSKHENTNNRQVCKVVVICNVVKCEFNMCRLCRAIKKIDTVEKRRIALQASFDQKRNRRKENNNLHETFSSFVIILMKTYCKSLKKHESAVNILQIKCQAVNKCIKKQLLK